MPPVLETRNISKTYPGVKALSEVSLSAFGGEVHAVVGENGAGKSTLMMILSGVVRADEGEVLIDDVGVCIPDALSAKRLGIGTVFQELSLVPELSVAENILAHHLPTRWGLIDRKTLHAKASDALARLGLQIDPRTRLGNLSIANRQLVEIAKALAQSTKLLILDEPTSSLTFAETDRLLALLRTLCTEGLGILFISHKMSEVFRVADRITVMREGRVISTDLQTDTNPDETISRMAGRGLAAERPRLAKSTDREAIRLRSVSRRRLFQDVSLHLRYGEIVGMAGLKGAGRSELAQAIFGLEKLDRGDVFWDNAPVRFDSPYEAIKAGLGYLPEDRKEQGLFLGLSVWENLVVSAMSKYTTLGIFRKALASEAARVYAERLSVRTPSVHTVVQNLSGGNQQKVLLARWLLCNPKVLIIDEPTRGVDVSARAEIHNLIRQQADQGTAVMLISSDLAEVMALSDRLYVMADGRIAGELTGGEISEDSIMRLATLARFASGKEPV